MIPKYLSLMWAAIAPALGNHLWQSTLFAIVAGLLTLLLRKNQARVRYWLWLAASVKFLVPFSLLIGIGNHLAWSRGFAGTKAGLYFAMEEVSQPFTQGTVATISPATSSTAFPSLIHVLPALLAAVWFSGFLVVLFLWYASWRQITAAKREAVPLREGREVEALRRMERVGRIRKRVEMLLSRASLEPGIFGIARPVLLWPEQISERLGEAHLEAILAHELWHVRRRDNLAAAIHMVVEAIFWFHPMVWWLGARLVEERERACDEEVLELGSERQVYAESILKICEYCVGSPLACVSGVTGADLKKRIVHIMTERVVRKLDFSKKLLLSAAGLVAVAVPIIFGLANATQSRAQSQAQSMGGKAPVYEVAAIKPSKSGNNILAMLNRPDGFTATGGTLQMLIQNAYDVQSFQIAGAPSWVNSDKYDIEAKIEGTVAEELQKLSPDQRRIENRRMLQALLADRFQLKLHRQTKELPVYALVIAKDGPKLHEAKPGDTYPNGFKGTDGHGGAGLIFMGGNGGPVTGQGIPIANLAHLLSQQLGRIVLDSTGLTGNYDVTLKWTPDDSTPMFNGSADGSQGPANAPSPDSAGPSIFTAVQEQLGLELKSQTGPVGILVIDHVETPSEN